MRLKTLLLLCLGLMPCCKAQAAGPDPKLQIAGALKAAPEDRRAGAAVLGYDGKGSVIELREGANDLVCIADNPAREKFSAACYHKDLAAYMARGRELSAKGIGRQENLETRWKEIDAGALSMSKEPRTLYVVSGESFDEASGEVVKPYLRYVIYTPYATAQSTGLSTKGGDSVPWIMFPGTAGAHIMINPPR
ncbi:MAG: hypothetical protein AAFQ82_02505 [Myxococcota bacterium]